MADKRYSSGMRVLWRDGAGSRRPAAVVRHGRDRDGTYTEIELEDGRRVKAHRSQLEIDVLANLDRLRASHTGGPGGYIGLIVLDRVEIWRCPHKHANRDTDAAHTAARPCAAHVLAALVDPGKTQRHIDAMCSGMPHFQNAWQVKEWQWTIERYRWALGVATDLRATIGGSR